jgi:hypothetical protein
MFIKDGIIGIFGVAYCKIFCGSAVSRRQKIIILQKEVIQKSHLKVNLILTSNVDFILMFKDILFWLTFYV